MATLKEQITGLPKVVTDYLEINTKLATETVAKLNTESISNLKFMIVGALISFLVTVGSGLILIKYTQTDTTELQKKVLELELKINSIQTDFHK